jgi:hypothetical protein
MSLALQATDRANPAPRLQGAEAMAKIVFIALEGLDECLMAARDYSLGRRW